MELWCVLFGSLICGALVYITLSIGSMAKDLYAIRKILEKQRKENKL